MLQLATSASLVQLAADVLASVAFLCGVRRFAAVPLHSSRFLVFITRFETNAFFICSHFLNPQLSFLFRFGFYSLLLLLMCLLLLC